MKKILKNKKIVILILFLLVGVGATAAYYANKVSIENTFKTATYNVTLEEEFYSKWGTKKVSIINKKDTNTPVVLRVSYIEVWSKTVDSTLYTLSNTVNGENVVTKEWTDAWTNDFIDGGDGWYYYTKTLNGGESVQILSSIAKNTSVITSEYDSYDYYLTFDYEAVQASSDAVNEAWGKTPTINGDNVTW